MFEGRALVHPLLLMLGARAVDRPETGYCLTATVLVAFEIETARLVEPARWCQAVAALGAGPPDTMAPLPGAELLVLTEAQARREGPVDIECGALEAHVALRNTGDATIDTGPRGAVWCERDNEWGRRRQAPSIMDRDRPERPIWLGPTPPDHPARLTLAGAYARGSGGRWGAGASAEIFHEAHRAFRAERIEPRDPIRIEGLTPHAIRARVPPWRVSIASGTSEGVWRTLPARIHTLAVAPGPGLAAVAWRASVDLDPHDPLGLRIEALVAALDDDGDSERGALELGRIAVDRWTDPALALDDRPLLPRSLRPLHAPIGRAEDSDPVGVEVSEATAWAQENSPIPGGNPFRGPDRAQAIREEIEALTEGRDPASLDANAIGALGDRALAMARERHEAAGLAEPSAKEETPERRGSRLDGEIALRLESAFSSERERGLRSAIRAHGKDAMDADEVLTGLASARAASPAPMTAWAPLPAREAARFGEALGRALGAGSLPRYADVAHATVAGQRIGGGSGVHLLAERTAWRDTVLEDVRIEGGSLAGSTWSGVVLRRCRIDGANLAQAKFEGCLFDSCELVNVQATDLTLVESRFRDCRLERVEWTDPAIRGVTFERGAWSEVAIVEGLLVGTTIEETALDRVTFLATHAPETTLRGVTLHKVWAMGKGFPGSRFEGVSARTCGFVGRVHFDESAIEGSTFEETGFSGAVFNGVRMDERTRFERCDFTGAAFAGGCIAGATMVECGLCASTWEEVDARRVRMRGAVLRGVDLRNVELAGAVILESDLEGTRFTAERTTGADLGRNGHAADAA